MLKKECVITACYPRKDIDWSILGFTVCCKEVNSNSEYVNRFDFGPASFEKTFWFKDESRLNSLVNSKCYLNTTLVLK